MTHTPGPWKVLGEDVVLECNEKEVVAWVGDIDGQMINNANLIAAAQEMLEALEEVVALTENLPVCPFCGAVKGVQSHRPDCLSHEINATIRKARGEE